MKKHIKVRCKLLPDNKNFSLEVLEQSHVGSGFGNDLENPHFFVHEDIALGSVCSVEFKYGNPYDRINETVGITLYVRGSIPSRNGVYKIKEIPLEYYHKIKAAIEAYNKHFSRQ